MQALSLLYALFGMCTDVVGMACAMLLIALSVVLFGALCVTLLTFAASHIGVAVGGFALVVVTGTLTSRGAA